MKPIVIVIVNLDYNSGEGEGRDDLRKTLTALAQQDFGGPAEFILVESDRFSSKVQPDLIRRAPHRALERIADMPPRNPIGGEPDRMFEADCLQERVYLRVGEGGIGAVVPALDLATVALDQRLQDILCTALPPMIQRRAGSRQRRSASLTSS